MFSPTPQLQRPEGISGTTVVVQTMFVNDCTLSVERELPMNYCVVLPALLLLLAATTCCAQPDHWSPLPSPPWGRSPVVGLEADSLNSLYALVSDSSEQVDGWNRVDLATLWRSRDKGTTWENLGHNLSPSFLIVDGGNGVLVGEYRFGVNELDVNTLRRPFTGRTELFTGTPSAVAWNHTGTTALGMLYVKYVDDVVSDLAVVRNDTVTRYTNLEYYFMPYPHITAVAVFDDGTVVTGFEGINPEWQENRRRSGIYRTTAADTTLRLIDSTLVPTTLYATSSGALLAANDSCILRSTDSGATWRAIDSTRWVESFTSDAAGTLYALGVRPLRSFDGGATWSRLDTCGTRIWSRRDSSVWTLLDGVPHRSMQGAGWVEVAAGLPESRSTGIAIANNGSLYATGKGGVGLYRLGEATGDVKRTTLRTPLDLR